MFLDIVGCGGPYIIKIEHFKHFLGGGGSRSPPPCQVGLRDAFKNEKVHKERIPSLHNLPYLS